MKTFNLLISSLAIIPQIGMAKKVKTQPLQRPNVIYVFLISFAILQWDSGAKRASGINSVRQEILFLRPISTDLPVKLWCSHRQ